MQTSYLRQLSPHQYFQTFLNKRNDRCRYFPIATSYKVFRSMFGFSLTSRSEPKSQYLEQKVPKIHIHLCRTRVHTFWVHLYLNKNSDNSISSTYQQKDNIWKLKGKICPLVLTLIGFIRKLHPY